MTQKMKTFMGINIVVSPYAMVTVGPKRPLTGDMTQMIDDMEFSGHPPQSRREPGGVYVFRPNGCSSEYRKTVDR